MIKLRRITNAGLALTNCCWLLTERGTPMVGLTYCKRECLHYRGEVKFLFWRFVKCNYRRL